MKRLVLMNLALCCVFFAHEPRRAARPGGNAVVLPQIGVVVQSAILQHQGPAGATGAQGAAGLSEGEFSLPYIGSISPGNLVYIVAFNAMTAAVQNAQSVILRKQAIGVVQQVRGSLAYVVFNGAVAGGFTDLLPGSEYYVDWQLSLTTDAMMEGLTNAYFGTAVTTTQMLVQVRGVAFA